MLAGIQQTVTDFIGNPFSTDDAAVAETEPAVAIPTSGPAVAKAVVVGPVSEERKSRVMPNGHPIESDDEFEINLHAKKADVREAGIVTPDVSTDGLGLWCTPCTPGQSSQRQGQCVLS